MTCASGCGKQRPERPPGKDDGWRRGYCPNCYRRLMGFKSSTEAVRRYRSDPEKAERDRERSRRWKEQNRERNRARDREYRRRRHSPLIRFDLPPGRLQQVVDAAVREFYGEDAA